MLPRVPSSKDLHAGYALSACLAFGCASAPQGHPNAHASPASAIGSSSTAEPQRSDDGEVFVRLEGEPELELRRAGGRFGKHLCFAPCDERFEVDEGTTLYLRGGDAVPPFELAPGRVYSVRIEGNQALATTGFVLSGIGFSAVASSGFAFLLHSTVQAIYDGEVTSDAKLAYTSVAASGAVVGAVGLSLLLFFEPDLVVRDRGPLSAGAERGSVRVDARGLRLEF